MSPSLFARFKTNRFCLIMASLLMATLAACDSTATSDSPTQETPKVVAQEDPTVVAERATLDTLLYDYRSAAYWPIQEIASHLDLSKNFDFSLPSGIDTTLLSDCVSGVVRCSSSTVNGKTTLQFKGSGAYNADITRRAIYPASATLDSLLDSTTRAASINNLSSITSILISSYSDGSIYAGPGAAGWGTTTLARVVKDRVLFSTYQSKGSGPRMYSSSAMSATILSIDGIPVGWSQASREKRWFEPQDGRLEWTAAVGSAIKPKADTMGTADIRWSSPSGDTIHGTVRFEGGKSTLLDLQAKKLSTGYNYAKIKAYDSIWLRAPDCLVLVKAKDTIFVWWHGTDMKAPTFDSLAFHFTTLGNRWTDARLRLRWDAPIQNAYSGSVTHLKLEGTESDGGHRIIEGDVIMNPSLNEPQIWKTYSSRLVR